MATITKGQPSTADQILTLACELAQTRGYNGFSYRDLARGVGIRTASIHHHFPTKADLGRAMIRQYRADFAGLVDEIDRSFRAPAEKIRAYLDLFRQTVRSECGVCLGGMLAAELLTLAPEVREELQDYFADGEAWLTEVLTQGAASGEITVQGSSHETAVAIISTLQGSMMMARAHGDAAMFDSAARWLVDSLTPP